MKTKDILSTVVGWDLFRLCGAAPAAGAPPRAKGCPGGRYVPVFAGKLPESGRDVASRYLSFRDPCIEHQQEATELPKAPKA
jgi:hypothetical protein